MKRWNWMVMACVLIATVGCADESVADNNTNGATNGATNAATNGSNNADAGRCIPATFAVTLPFDANDDLPFSFQIPAGFGNIDESSVGRVGGSIFDITDDGERGEFQTHYLVDRETDSTREAWVDAGYVPDVADLDGTAIDAWTKFRDEGDETKLYFDDHLVTFEWLGPESCVEERRLIQDAMLGSLSRNPDTNF